MVLKKIEDIKFCRHQKSAIWQWYWDLQNLIPTKISCTKVYVVWTSTYYFLE